MIRFIDSIRWFDSMLRFIASIHWFDSFIRCFDSIHKCKWIEHLSRRSSKWKHGRRSINKKVFWSQPKCLTEKTCSKINWQNIFFGEQNKTIGKWVQKRQTLIFTVANFFLVVFYVLFWTLMVKPDEFSKGPGTPGPAGRSGRCTLCVCFLGDPSLMPHENPKK